MTRAWAVLTALAAVVLICAIAAPARAATYPAGFSEVTLAEGLERPTGLTFAPDGRLFVAEKEGRVRVVGADGILRRRPLLDFSDRVNSYSDRGLLGIATDRDFAANGWLYLLYNYAPDPSLSQSNGPTVSVLTRVTVRPDNTLADSGREQVILGQKRSSPCPPPDNASDCLPADGTSHAIGTVRVDPGDGTLWVGSGDAWPNGKVDPGVRPQDDRSYAGKILHIGRDGRGLPGHPFCPGNGDLSQACTKVYAKGFRNPFRFNLRPGGGLVVADVGHFHYEEINLVQAGRNYGWPCYEGNGKTSNDAKQRYPDFQATAACKALYAKPGSVTPPAWSYSHGPRGGSAIGGPTYVGSSYPAEWRGGTFVGDYALGEMSFLRFDGAGKATRRSFATGWPAGVDLQLDPRTGDLVYVDINFTGRGAVRRIAYAPGNRPPVARASASATAAGTRLSSAGSSDPDGNHLTYDWDFGDGSEHSAEPSPLHRYARGTYTARVRVSDGRGPSATASVQVVVDGGSAANAPPVARILAPTDGASYGNQMVPLCGTGSDPDGDPLTYEWDVLQHHGAHLHGFVVAGASSSFAIDQEHSPDIFYEVRLNVTDAHGLTGTAAATLRYNGTGAPVPMADPCTAPPAPPGSPAPGAQTPGAPATPASAANRPGLRKLSVSLKSRRRVVVRVSCNGPTACTGTARVEGMVKSRSRSRSKSKRLVPKLMARRAYALPAGARKSFTLVLSRGERALLRRQGKTATIRVRLRSSTGGASASRMLRVRRSSL